MNVFLIICVFQSYMIVHLCLHVVGHARVYACIFACIHVCIYVDTSMSLYVYICINVY